jgi:restriction system protein
VAIPDFQTVMLPVLTHLKDGREKSNAEILDALASRFGLTEDERTSLLPSGRQGIFVNRVAWAKSHLKAAGLVESFRRGNYKITNRGLEVLNSHPNRVDLRVLKQFPEYVEFRKGKRDGTTQQPVPTLEGETDELTPEEQLEYGNQRVREQLCANLLEKLKAASPGFFEKVVVELLVAMGYGGSRQDAGQTVGRAGDGGIDGVIKEDRLGLDFLYIQAKKWKDIVGRPEIQKFAGALQGQRAKRGVFITTSDFTKEAMEYAAMIDSRIVLIGGSRLANLMIDHGIGVTTVASYEVKRIDSDYFEE